MIGSNIKVSFRCLQSKVDFGTFKSAEVLMVTMPSVESVLRRSRSLDNPPYSGSLELKGFEVGLVVHGKVTGHQSYTTDVEATSPLLAAENIPTTTTTSQIEAIDVESFLPKAPRASGLKEVFHPSVDASLCVFEYNDSEYIVGPIGKKVYTASLEGSVEVTLVRELNRATPIDFSLERLQGTLKETDDGRYQFESEPTGVFEKLFSNNHSIEFLTVEEPRNCYTLDELNSNAVVFTTEGVTERLVPCTLSVSESTFTVIAEVDGGEVEWTFPIDEFGRLPEIVTEVFDLDSLYLYVEQDKTAFARVRPAEYGESEILTDTNDEYIIDSFE